MLIGNFLRSLIGLLFILSPSVWMMRYVGEQVRQPLLAYYHQPPQSILYSIRIIDLHHKTYQDIPVLSNPRPLQWSHNGRYLYFSDFTSTLTDEDIYRYDIFTGARQRITDATVPEYSPIISPDGSWVLYNGGQELLLRHLPTGETQVIQAFFSTLFDIGEFAAWSPDSRWLIYQFDNTLYWYDLATQANLPVNKAAAVGRFMQWSEDSTRFWYADVQGNVIEVMLPDGIFQRIYTIDRDRQARFIITPDGEHLAYNQYNPNQSNASIVMWAAETQQASDELTQPDRRFRDNPMRWIDDQHLVFMRSQDAAFPNAGAQASLYMLNINRPESPIFLSNFHDYTLSRTFAMWYPPQ